MPITMGAKAHMFVEVTERLKSLADSRDDDVAACRNPTYNVNNKNLLMSDLEVAKLKCVCKH